MNARRKFIAIVLALAGLGRRAQAFGFGRLRTRQAAAAVPEPDYAPLTTPVVIPIDSVATPWRPAPFVAEATAPPTKSDPKPRRVLISGVLFRTADHLSALCVTCPHEQCQVDLVTDDVRLKKMGGTADRPLFECGCHFSVFDAAKEGERISGESPRGLYRFRIGEIRAGMVSIAEVERSALTEV